MTFWMYASGPVRSHGCGVAQKCAACPDLGPELLPAPEPDEVVAALAQQVEVRREVELFGRAAAGRAGAHAIMEVVVEVRAGQVDRPLARGIAARDGEVARIGR